MASLNKVQLIGRLGMQPDVKYLPSGQAVLNISLATSENWTDKQSGEKKEQTEWHRLVFFGRQAEIVKQYLNKGSQIYVEGRLQTRKWQKDGQDHYTTETIVANMQMLDSRGSSTSAPMDDGHFNQSANQGGSFNQSPAPSGNFNQNAAPAAGANNDFDDDDIPF